MSNFQSNRMYSWNGHGARISEFFRILREKQNSVVLAFCLAAASVPLQFFEERRIVRSQSNCVDQNASDDT